MKGRVKRFSMCGGEKPRHPQCFKPGDMLIFAKEDEIAILTKRFDLYAEDGKVSRHPSWCWNMCFTPGNNIPMGYQPRYGVLETNLYNQIGYEIEYIPAPPLKGKK